MNRPKEKLKNNIPNEGNLSINFTPIREVFAHNFVEEIKNLSLSLEKYNYVAMDTEFPGVVYQPTSRETYYKTVKANVDKLKLIQVGITLCDENGQTPQNGGTWQFNLNFNLNSDLYSNESIALLTNSGINFETLETRGIPQEVFGEYIITSGLILNDIIHWISFHGIYDFAYFLKIITNLPLPESESAFFESLKLYFCNYYDIRFLVRYNDCFRGSLSKLGQELNVSRVGIQHQAGSDSLITSEIFFKLKKDYLSDESTINDRNVLFGIGQGLEDSDYSSSLYFNSGNANTNSNLSVNGMINQYRGANSMNTLNNVNNMGNNYNMNMNFDYSNFYNQMNMNMQYNTYLRNNNPGYYQNMTGGVNYFPYNNYSQLGMQYNLINSNSTGSIANNNNTSGPVLSEETKKKYNLNFKNVED